MDQRVSYDGERYDPEAILKMAMLWESWGDAEIEALHDAAEILKRQRDEARAGLHRVATAPLHA